MHLLMCTTDTPPTHYWCVCWQLFTSDASANTPPFHWLSCQQCIDWQTTNLQNALVQYNFQQTTKLFLNFFKHYFSSWWDTMVCTTCIQWACWDILLLHMYFTASTTLPPPLKQSWIFLCLTRLASFLYVHNIDKGKGRGSQCKQDEINNLKIAISKFI